MSGLYLDNIVQQDCDATDNVFIDVVEGDGLLECGSLETVDTCGVSPDKVETEGTTVAPAPGTPTKIPHGKPTKMPSDDAGTEEVTGMPSAGYKMVGLLPLVVYVSLGALVMRSTSL